MTSIVANWGKARVKLTWEESNELPPRENITSVHGFCFDGGKVVMVDLDKRGWDFPGGHIENGESAEDCFKREAMEEGCIEGTCTLLGHVIVDNSENETWSEDGPYPKIGYQVFYHMTIEQIHPFQAEFEAAERMFVSPKEVANYHGNWHELNQAILDCAKKVNEEKSL